MRISLKKTLFWYIYIFLYTFSDRFNGYTSLLMQIANQPIMWQLLKMMTWSGGSVVVCRSDQTSEWGRIVIKVNNSTGMIVVPRRGGLSVSETADLMGFSDTAVSKVQGEWCDKKETKSGEAVLWVKTACEERGVWPQITTRYRSGMQKLGPSRDNA